MKQTFVLLLLLLPICPTYATPICPTTATLADYIGLGAGGCTIGPLTFNNFTYSFSGIAVPAVPASLIGVSTNETGGPYLDHQITFESSAWQLRSGFPPFPSKRLDSEIGYDVHAPSGFAFAQGFLIGGVGLDGPSVDGDERVSGSFCGADASGVFPGIQDQICFLGTPTTTQGHVQDSIILSARETCCVTTDSVTADPLQNAFFLQPVTKITPEPTTVLKLLCGGLLLCGSFLKRAKF